MILGGTPQSFWLVSRNDSILASLTAKFLNSGQTSSRDALRSLAALIKPPLFVISSRIAGKVVQIRCASEGGGAMPPENPPGAGALKPPPPGDGGALKPPPEGPMVMRVGPE